MNFESQEEYDHYNGAAEQEYMEQQNAAAQAEADNEAAYDEYLGSLLKEGNFLRYSALVAADWFESLAWSNSDLKPAEFLRQMADRFDNKAPDVDTQKKDMQF